jgi:hypothetical protein
MPIKVFISYRREDTAPYAGRIRDRLEREFGNEAIFLDVEKIPYGDNFLRVVLAEVAGCQALLALIGPTWINSQDLQGKRRLEMADDPVRLEIASALHRQIPVIPILVGKATIPQADHLPDDLKGLCERNALDVRDTSFDSDVSRLIDALKALRPASKKTRGREESVSTGAHSVGTTAFLASGAVIFSVIGALIITVCYAEIATAVLGEATNYPKINGLIGFGLMATVLYFRHKLITQPLWLGNLLVTTTLSFFLLNAGLSVIGGSMLLLFGSIVSVLIILHAKGRAV